MRVVLLLVGAATMVSYGINDFGIEINGCYPTRQDSQTPQSSRFKTLKEASRGNPNGHVRGTRIRRQVLRDHRFPLTTWQDGVFYTFNTSDHTVQKAFKMGVKVWSDATCIDFNEDRNAKDKVVVLKDGGSHSSIGRLGGDQFLALGGRTTEGAAVHEIGHVLGFFHTMSRYDRDSRITIVEQNLDPLCIKQFEKMARNISEIYAVEYDYGSIMHYGELSCSTNKRPTIIAKEPYYQKTMGSELISFSDIYTINEHYGCSAKCNKSISAKCANEGFPHPRNCSKCICPSGYGGALCDRRPSGCGGDLVATSRKQTVSFRLGRRSGLRGQFDFCHYMITAPHGKRIEVDLQVISQGYDSVGCIIGGVEIKAQRDQKLTGYRFCSMRGSGGSIVSSSSRLPIILYNRYGMMQTIFKYRYVG